MRSGASLSTLVSEYIPSIRRPGPPGLPGVLRSASKGGKLGNIGASAIRIGFRGPFFHKYDQEPPK